MCRLVFDPHSSLSGRPTCILRQFFDLLSALFAKWLERVLLGLLCCASCLTWKGGTGHVLTRSHFPLSASRQSLGPPFYFLPALSTIRLSFCISTLLSGVTYHSFAFFVPNDEQLRKQLRAEDLAGFYLLLGRLTLVRPT